MERNINEIKDLDLLNNLQIKDMLHYQCHQPVMIKMKEDINMYLMFMLNLMIQI